jgi:hypothetical protein
MCRLVTGGQIVNKAAFEAWCVAVLALVADIFAGDEWVDVANMAAGVEHVRYIRRVYGETTADDKDVVVSEYRAHVTEWVGGGERDTVEWATGETEEAAAAALLATLRDRAKKGTTPEPLTHKLDLSRFAAA